MTYQTLDDAILHEDVSDREELIALLSTRYDAHRENTDIELLEKINRYCSEHVWHPDREIANDPIEW
jgi:hypothetical protein